MINSSLIFVVLLGFLVGTHADLAEKFLPADYVDFWILRLNIESHWLWNNHSSWIPSYTVLSENQI